MLDRRLLLDRNNLDTDLIENPSLVQEVGDELADAIAFRDTLKEALDVVDAELDSEIREEFEKLKKKCTEAMIAQAIKLHPDHKKAFDGYNDAKLKAAKAAALEKAVSARSDALRLLADLFKSGYFAINSTRETQSTREVQYQLMREKLAVARNSAIMGNSKE